MFVFVCAVVSLFCISVRRRTKGSSINHARLEGQGGGSEKHHEISQGGTTIEMSRVFIFRLTRNFPTRKVGG